MQLLNEGGVIPQGRVFQKLPDFNIFIIVTKTKLKLMAGMTTGKSRNSEFFPIDYHMVVDIS
jgi:hypothetical protein